MVTIKANTTTEAHNRVREKIRVRLLSHKTLLRQNLRTIPNGVYITTHTVSETESANSLARSTLIDLKCSNFTPKTSTNPFADMYNTHWCYYYNQYGDRARNCTFPCSYIKDNSSHSQHSKNSPYRYSDTLFWVRDKISNRIFSLDSGACVSVLSATPTLIQRAKRDYREFRSAGGHQLRSYSVVLWFPTFSVSGTLWTIWVKAADPFIVRLPNPRLLVNLAIPSVQSFFCCFYMFEVCSLRI